MTKKGKFNETYARFYLCELIIAVEYLHQNNIIYRDLKPENILIDEIGHIKYNNFFIILYNYKFLI